MLHDNMLDDPAWRLLDILYQGSPFSPLAITAVMAMGLVMGVAPSSYALYPVVAGYVGGQAGGRRGLWPAAGFVLGMATVDAALGVLFGFLGGAVIRVMAGYLPLTNLALAALLALFGLVLLRKLRINVPVFRPQPHAARTFGAAYLLGIPFGFSICPGCAPMIVPILGAAALTGTPWLGGALLLVFGLARGVPLLVVGAVTDKVVRVPRLMFWAPAIERASGMLLLVAAAYFLYQSAMYAQLVPPLW